MPPAPRALGGQRKGLGISLTQGEGCSICSAQPSSFQGDPGHCQSCGLLTSLGLAAPSNKSPWNPSLHGQRNKSGGNQEGLSPPRLLPPPFHIKRNMSGLKK